MIKSIKEAICNFIIPSRIEKRSHFILGISWFMLASITLVLGVVLGIVVDWMKSINVLLNFYLVLSLCCIIPLLHIVIKLTIKAITGAVAIGKKIKHTETEISQVSPAYNIYEVRQVERNEGGLWGVICTVISLLFYYFLFVFAGAIILIVRYTFTIKEIVKYSRYIKTSKAYQ